jgi:hypothetical protein
MSFDRMAVGLGKTLPSLETPDSIRIDEQD